MNTKDKISINPVRQFSVTNTQTTENGAPWLIEPPIPDLNCGLRDYYIKVYSVPEKRCIHCKP